MGIYTVELYLKVRLACSEGMSRRQAAKHFNISRDSVAKMGSVNGGVKTGHGAEQKSATMAPALDRREGIARAGVSGRRGDFGGGFQPAFLARLWARR